MEQTVIEEWAQAMQQRTSKSKNTAAIVAEQPAGGKNTGSLGDARNQSVAGKPRKRPRRAWGIHALGVALALSACAGEWVYQQTMAETAAVLSMDPVRLQASLRLRDHFDKATGPLVLHGRVLDAEGNPQANVAVDCRVETVGMDILEQRLDRQVKRLACRTDADGNFSVEAHGLSLRIASMAFPDGTVLQPASDAWDLAAGPKPVKAPVDCVLVGENRYVAGWQKNGTKHESLAEAPAVFVRCKPGQDLATLPTAGGWQIARNGKKTKTPAMNAWDPVTWGTLALGQ